MKFPMNLLRISAYGLLAALLTLLAQPCRAQVNDSVAAHYKARYITLYHALVEKDDDIQTLIALSDFYADSLNPMYNRTLAMDYIVKADKLFTALLKNGRRIREANRLVSQGVTVDGIRNRRRDIADKTLTYLQSLPPLTQGEITHAIEVFKGEPKVLQQLKKLKVIVAYRNAAQNSTDSVYGFLTRYEGTVEADSAEANLYHWAVKSLKQASTAAQVDDIAQRYPKSVLVQRAAQKRKGHIAFQEAYNLHTPQAYHNYLVNYPSSDDYMLALEIMDTLALEDLYMMHHTQDYVDFILNHNGEPLGEKALQLLRDRVVKHHDTEAARIYLSKFPLDIDYARIYQTYYGWHAAEGNLEPILSFAKSNPDYPGHEQLRDDRAQAVDIDEFDLLRPYSNSMEKDYTSFVRMNTGKRIVFVAMQRMMQPALDGKRWKAALQLLQDFSLSFEQDNLQEYQQLKQLLENAAAEKATATSDPQWKDTIPHIFIPGFAGDMEFFCLYDGGKKMLLGHDGDILCAHRSDGIWHLDEPLPSPVNTPYWETDAYMLPDGSGLLLASDRPGGCNVQTSRCLYHGDTALATDLYFIPCHNGQWGDAIHLDVPVNTPYCERYPVMSSNGTTLYFVSDGRGGMGYGDIYRTDRLDESWQRWSEPENLGRETNSAHRESHLSLSADERVLYFQSNRSGNSNTYRTAARHQPTQVPAFNESDGCWNLDNIAFFYDNGIAYITHPGRLVALAQHLRQHPDMQIDIISRHQGVSNEESYSVSLQRGNAVRRYLIRHGISRDRIRVSAYGNMPDSSHVSLQAQTMPANGQ